MLRTRRTAPSALTVALTMLLSACSPATTGGGRDEAGTAAALQAFDSCDALTTELRRRGLAQLAAGGPAEVLGGVTRDMAVAAEAQSSGATGSAPAVGAGTWSDTNVQVEGVDEPDVVKTDGTYLYMVADGALRVVDVREDRPEVAATLPMDDGAPRDLLLHGDRLLVLGDAVMAPGGRLDPRASDERDVAMQMLGQPRTRLWSVDITDPAQPRIESTMAVDGGLLTARLTDGIARVVIRSLPVLPYALRPPGVEADEVDVGRQIADATSEQLLPRVTVDGGGSAPLVACSAVRAPDSGDDLGLVSLLSLDLDRADLDADRVDAVLGGADTVYADADSLYVTTSRWPVVLPVEPLPLPAEPLPSPAADRAVEPSPATVTTEVHRFDLSADGATYVASGSVPGTVLNQWALSEHDDHLRIATTIDDGTRRRSHSAVHVLRRDGAQLVEVGRTGDLGRGERIYAVRYAGALGFVVTFRQVDPLYTLDLSDPTAPSVLGELKIPGYSAYLHPVGEDHLLGIGQDADPDGRVTGLQISLFDVSNLHAPARVGQVGLGPQTSSPVEYDHRALLAWPDHDLVAVPVERWDDGGSDVLVLTATDDGRLAERGTIELGATVPGAMVRTVVVGDRLLTVSPDLVTVSDLATLARRAELRL